MSLALIFKGGNSQISNEVGWMTVADVHYL
jgi:hypothetical protein